MQYVQVGSAQVEYAKVTGRQEQTSVVIIMEVQHHVAQQPIIVQLELITHHRHAH
jgi:2-polyprenyl-3-methyl-5-hydroxy-6-metoxy-1,4-benzoquinol methylase